MCSQKALQVSVMMVLGFLQGLGGLDHREVFDDLGISEKGLDVLGILRKFLDVLEIFRSLDVLEVIYSNSLCGC